MRWKLLKTAVIFLFFRFIADDEFWDIYYSGLGNKNNRFRDVWRAVKANDKKEKMKKGIPPISGTKKGASE